MVDSRNTPDASLDVADGKPQTRMIAEAARLLRAVAGDNARREARLMLAHTLSVTPEKIMFSDDRLLTGREQYIFGHYLSRRISRQPLAQILGEKEFYGRKFIVNANVLTPRPESELLVDKACAFIARRNDVRQVVDLGTGSGCLLLSILAESAGITGLGVDRSRAALRVAKDNARQLGLMRRAVFAVSDWTQALQSGFDIIVANPPYIAEAEMPALMPEVGLFEPHLALDGGSDGLTAYRQIATDLQRLARPGALILLECGAGQADAVAAILTSERLTVTEIYDDLAGCPRVIAATC